MARNGAGIALVHLAEGRTLQQREGDQLGPWVVKWIGDRSAVFRQGRHDVELTLDFKHPAATPGGN